MGVDTSGLERYFKRMRQRSKDLTPILKQLESKLLAGLDRYLQDNKEGTPMSEFETSWRVRKGQAKTQPVLIAKSLGNILPQSIEFTIPISDATQIERIQQLALNYLNSKTEYIGNKIAEYIVNE